MKRRRPLGKAHLGAAAVPGAARHERRQAAAGTSGEMPEGLEGMTPRRGRDMDTEGTCGHVMAGDLRKAADYTGQAINSNLCRK